MPAPELSIVGRAESRFPTGLPSGVFRIHQALNYREYPQLELWEDSIHRERLTVFGETPSMGVSRLQTFEALRQC